jgi:hypothetical protein
MGHRAVANRTRLAAGLAAVCLATGLSVTATGPATAQNPPTHHPPSHEPPAKSPIAIGAG